MNALILVPSGVGTEELTDPHGDRAKAPLLLGGLIARSSLDRQRVADARGVRRRRGPRAEPESIPARVRGSFGPRQAATAAAVNSSAGRPQPSVLRGRSLTSAAIRAMSSAVWTLRSVPFGK